MKTCLLTGAPGFIGSHLLQSLVGKFHVFALSKTAEDILPSQRLPNVTWLITDLANPCFVKDLPPQIDAVIHLAQSPNFRKFPDCAEDIFSVNTLSTLHLLEYARKTNASSFVLASSVPGPCENKCIFSEKPIEKESHPLHFYHTSRKCAELLAENYASFLNIVILRFFFVYGPEQGKSMLIPRLVTSILEEKPISLNGDEGILLNPVYVADAVNAIENALNLAESHKINIAGSEVFSLKKLCELIGNKINKKPIFEFVNNNTTSLVSNNEKMLRLLGRPLFTFEDGIDAYINASHDCSSL